MAQTIPWTAPPEAKDLPVRGLRIALILGAIVDLALGAIPLLFFPSWMSTALGEPVSGSLKFWPMYSSVFLFVLPVFYLLGAADPARNIVIIVAAIVGRLAGAVFYGVCVFLLAKHAIFASMSIMNLLFALYYAGALGPAGRMLIRGALRPPR
jgi:hypothetical protein